MTRFSYDRKMQRVFDRICKSKPRRPRVNRIGELTDWDLNYLFACAAQINKDTQTAFAKLDRETREQAFRAMVAKWDEANTVAEETRLYKNPKTHLNLFWFTLDTDGSVCAWAFGCIVTVRQFCALCDSATRREITRANKLYLQTI